MAYVSPRHENAKDKQPPDATFRTSSRGDCTTICIHDNVNPLTLACEVRVQYFKVLGCVRLPPRFGCSLPLPLNSRIVELRNCECDRFNDLDEIVRTLSTGRGFFQSQFPSEIGYATTSHLIGNSYHWGPSLSVRQRAEPSSKMTIYYVASADPQRSASKHENLPGAPNLDRSLPAFAEG